MVYSRLVLDVHVHTNMEIFIEKEMDNSNYNSRAFSPAFLSSPITISCFG